MHRPQRLADALSRKIALQIFSDRIVVASPGYPPSPLTLAKLHRGNYRPCSRNSVIAQALAMMHLMEQRGSGFSRTRDTMLDHGLDAPLYAQQDGYFVVTFHSPKDDYDRLKLPEAATGIITPAVEAQLSDRQRKMVSMMLRGDSQASRGCQRKFKLSAPAISEDFLLSPAGPTISLGLRSISTFTQKTGHNLLLGLRRGAVLCSTLFKVF
jgi:predicted HTH transcriptional regulator